MAIIFGGEGGIFSQSLRSFGGMSKQSTGLFLCRALSRFTRRALPFVVRRSGRKDATVFANREVSSTVDFSQLLGAVEKSTAQSIPLFPPTKKHTLPLWRKRQFATRPRVARLDESRNSALHCFSVAPCLVTLVVHSLSWFESPPSRQQKKHTVRCAFFWRRRRDSNPRTAINGYTISNRARSTNYATSPNALLLYTSGI